VKIRFVPVHIKTAYRGRRYLAPFILNLRTGCRCVWSLACLDRSKLG